MRVSAEVVNCVAVGDWMGDPDVTLGWGRGAVWDGEGDVVKAELRWLGVEETVPAEVEGGGGVVRGVEATRSGGGQCDDGWPGGRMASWIGWEP